MAGASVQAQESIRPSAIGAAASDTRQGPTALIRSDFMRLGPVDVNASVGMGVEFTDNVGISEYNRQSDVIFRPQLNVDSEWKVSRLNTIRLGLGLSLAKYARSTRLDTQTLLLAPGTQLGFDVYVGEHLRLNIHNRIAIVQNPIDELTLSNADRFARLLNSAGVTAYLRYPEHDFVFGYDHFNYKTLSSEYNYMDRAEEQFFLSARRRLSDAFGAGLEASAALVNYTDDVNNDGTTWTVGAFADTTLSDYTKLRISGGYQNMNFERNGSNGDRSNHGGWYGNLTVAQRVTQYLSHSLTLGHEAVLGLSVNFAEYDFARYAATWRMNPTWTWGFDAFVEDANESGGPALSAEHAFRWGAGVSLAWQIANRTTLGLRYQYVDKESDLALRSYYQNSTTISLTYHF
jgi:Outer membrane protein beta-barrel domain